MNITIVGFGNIAHALVAYLGDKKEINISVLSSSKTDSSSISLYNNNATKGFIKIVSDEPSDIVSNSDLILLTVPSHVRYEAIKKIAPFVAKDTIIGAFPGVGGFYDEVKEVVGDKITVFASQRVPYIARIVEKGKIVNATQKEFISIAVNHNKRYIKNLLSELLSMQVNLLDSFMEVHLTNSNPILHSARLCSLYEKSYPLKNEVLFYKEWDDFASKILLQMDEEFMRLVSKLGLTNICSLKRHYGVQDYKEMSQKLQSIEAFKVIKTPLIKVEDKYVFDINSRYFQEDINHDLLYIIKTAQKHLVDMPTINKVYKELCLLLGEK
jgi:ketopantoate reductase